MVGFKKICVLPTAKVPGDHDRPIPSLSSCPPSLLWSG
ncbi:Protein of unknown function [Pyronema omphalodes CBS 100304]|uniref:Uncharacterized protein n=1 Tax=Pyronema omphalodes (strain CBS 100304) TaxID=1076935 RepID=U4KXX3_PYROM|nr:Protein of unknown function [Pyronema omphalodes CBS 100304]